MRPTGTWQNRQQLRFCRPCVTTSFSEPQQIGFSTYLKGVSPGLRCLVTSSNCLPFLATNSANFVATFSTSGSVGAQGPEGAGQEAQRRRSENWWQPESGADNQSILSGRQEQHDREGAATCWFKALSLRLLYVIPRWSFFLLCLEDRQSSCFDWLIETRPWLDSLSFLDTP